MELLKRFLLTAIRKRFDKFASQPTKYIFYRIIDVDPSMEKYTLHCINTRMVFCIKLADMIADENIIYRLHPTQACYIGMEYAKIFKGQKSIPMPNYPDASHSLSVPRGIYYLCYQDRKNNLCFMCYKTKKEFIMDPRDIVLSEALIEGFNTIQAFYIGFLAGLKMHDAQEGDRFQRHEKLRRPYLWLVK